MPIEFKASFDLAAARERIDDFFEKYPHLIDEIQNFKVELLSSDLDDKYSNAGDFVDAVITKFLCLSKGMEVLLQTQLI